MMPNINSCPISGDKLYPVISLGKQPIFLGTTNEPETSDQFNEMDWLSTRNGIVHLGTRLPLELLYAKSHNSGLIGEVWRTHHQKFADFISKFQPKDVGEIGGGHGILSRIYSEKNQFNSWEIFEPNPSAKTRNNIIVRDEFFSETTVLNEKDCFVHSHLFEHLYDHGSILYSIHCSLTDNGTMIFSLPNLKKMVERGYINALNFEHVTYLPEDLVEHLLLKHGFTVEEKQYYLDDHSIFYYCKKSSPNPSLTYYNKNNIETVRGFYQRSLQEIQSINEKIRSEKTGSSIYLFGAHIFSQFYLTNGLEDDRIIEILDNDESKQNCNFTVLN